jgi:hypothetical protein
LHEADQGRLRRRNIFKRCGAAAYPRLPRRFKKVSRKRPEITNLNHQYAFRRVDMVPSSKIRGALAGSSVAPATAIPCDLVHIRPGFWQYAPLIFHVYSPFRPAGEGTGRRLSGAIVFMTIII